MLKNDASDVTEVARKVTRAEDIVYSSLSAASGAMRAVAGTVGPRKRDGTVRVLRALAAAAVARGDVSPDLREPVVWVNLPFVLLREEVSLPVEGADERDGGRVEEVEGGGRAGAVDEAGREVAVALLLVASVGRANDMVWF